MKYVLSFHCRIMNGRSLVKHLICIFHDCRLRSFFPVQCKILSPDYQFFTIPFQRITYPSFSLTLISTLRKKQNKNTNRNTNKNTNNSKNNLIIFQIAKNLFPLVSASHGSNFTETTRLISVINYGFIFPLARNLDFSIVVCLLSLF